MKFELLHKTLHVEQEIPRMWKYSLISYKIPILKNLKNQNLKEFIIIYN